MGMEMKAISISRQTFGEEIGMQYVKSESRNMMHIVRECKLDNGYIDKYDMCDSVCKVLGASVKLDLAGFVYLGIGVIHSINNNAQNSKEKYHFWKNK